MLDKRNLSRYVLLKEQLKVEESSFIHDKVTDSLTRIIIYLYRYTDITYLNFINEETLYNYIKYHKSLDIDVVQAIKDVKILLFVLQNIKNIKDPPQLDLSTTNIRFWRRL